MTPDEKELLELKFLRQIVGKMDSNLQNEMENGNMADGFFESAYRKKHLAHRLNAINSQLIDIDERIVAKLYSIEAKERMEHTTKTTQAHFFQFI